MKNKCLFSFITVVIMVFSICTILPVKISVPFEAGASGVDNIVARADYLYNTTWTAQATVKGWRDNYTFSKGSVYHIPYGQPVTEGKYICWGVSVDNFLADTQNASSEFYSTRSYYSGNSDSYSTYYAMDCSAFVSYCWDLPNRTTTSSWSSLSVTSYEKCTSENVNKIQAGDALNLAGSHIVIVSDVTYDSNGNVIQVEITEQAPPETKRSYYTASELVSKYSSYTIYRYNKCDSVTPTPDVPDPDSSDDKYFPKCDSGYKSLIEALDSLGIDSSKEYRTVIAHANGISDYTFSSEQNIYMLNLFKEGRLINPDDKSSNNKKWYDDMTPVNIGECFAAYIINTSCWKHFTAEDNDNVMMTSETRKAEQMWHFTRKSDGSYRIINCKTGKALDAGGLNNNLYTYELCDNSWQSWYIYGSSGEYFLKSQESDYVVDIVGGYTDDRTNAQMYEYNGSDAQKFQIYMLDEFGNMGLIQNLGDNFSAYIINTKSQKPIESDKDGNVAINEKTNSSNQIWKFNRKNDGSYTIVNCDTGKVLDAGGLNNNLYTYESCDNGWQSWYIFGSSGSYILKSQGSNNVIDIFGGYTDNGTNAHMHEANGTVAQIFNIEETELMGDINSDNKINISDAVILQKWLLGISDTKVNNWKSADLCEDGRLDAFDMIEMRKLIINYQSAK